MPVNINDKIRKLSPKRRKKVEARVAELLAEEMTLRELRRARRLTQVQHREGSGHHPRQRVAARKPHRSAIVHAPQKCRGDGRPSVARRRVSRPRSGGTLGHRRGQRTAEAFRPNGSTLASRRWIE
jgi:hypothetical protein